jgi:hypothetical protein
MMEKLKEKFKALFIVRGSDEFFVFLIKICVYGCFCIYMFSGLSQEFGCNFRTYDFSFFLYWEVYYNGA